MEITDFYFFHYFIILHDLITCVCENIIKVRKGVKKQKISENHGGLESIRHSYT